MKKIALWGGLIVILLASTFGLMQLVNSSTPSSSSVLSSIVNLPAVSKNEVTVGNPKAKAVLIEYSDFQCPACANSYFLVEQLLKDYDGKILFVYRFFPLTQTHKNALPSSYAAYAAFLQGKFPEMEDEIFTNQIKWKDENNARDIFLSYAEKIGLDMEKYKKDVNSDETIKIVSDSENSAISLGINSTPTFFLNGKQIQPRGYDEFKKLVEGELKMAK